MALPTNLTLEDLSSRYSLLRARQMELPQQIGMAREAITKAEAAMEEAERHQALLTLGIKADKQLGLDEREHHHIGLDLKSLKASVLKNKSQIDSLMSESSMLKHLERELGVAMQLKQDQRDRLANKLMADSLCPTIIDEAREALAELLFYVSVRNGINPAALNQDSTIQTILNEDRKLNKAVETIYNTRKTEAIQTIKQKEAQ